MKTKTESEKFNTFLRGCEDFAQKISVSKEIPKSFPRFVLNLFFGLNKETVEESLRGLGSYDQGLDAFFISEKEKKYYLI